MNKALLRYEMDLHGVTTEQMAEALGISRSAFWRKCNGVSEFRQSEIQKIIRVLDLQRPADIFFSDEVS